MKNYRYFALTEGRNPKEPTGLMRELETDSEYFLEYLDKNGEWVLDFELATYIFGESPNSVQVDDATARRVAQKIAPAKKFHLAGTDQDHDQSTHAPNGGGGTDESGQRELPGMPKPVDPVKLARKKTESVLENNEITSTEDLGGGINVTQLLEIDAGDGKTVSAVFKPVSGEKFTIGEIEDEDGNWIPDPDGDPIRPNIDCCGAAREATASDVAEVLGLTAEVPVVVTREVDGEPGALLEFKNNELEVAQKYYGAMDYLTEDKIGRYAAFDYIIGNEDRHAKNWLVEKNTGRVALIDHGLSFPSDNDWGIRSMFYDRASADSFSIQDSIGDDWDNKWPAIEKAMIANGIVGTYEKQAARERFDELMRVKREGGTFADLSLERQSW